MYDPSKVHNKSGAGKDARHRCPQCKAVGPLMTDIRRGISRPIVGGCRCLDPPTPEEAK